jgi:ubiquinone/menaquinone biosynthesis C-methylase UbiE
MKPNEQENIFTDEIDYAKTGNNSVWGDEDKATNDLIKTIKGGKWLNLCAGDGRFNLHLLERAEQVTAADIDPSALQKLYRITPLELIKKLATRSMNVTMPFPFETETIDGIFCSGTLHLFPKDIFKRIFQEMDRVLKHNGKMIIDFATDIERRYPDGSLWIVKNEPNYSLQEALAFLQNIFQDYSVQIVTDKVEPEKVQLGDKEYMFSSNFILIQGTKS